MADATTEPAALLCAALGLLAARRDRRLDPVAVGLAWMAAVDVWALAAQDLHVPRLAVVLACAMPPLAAAPLRAAALAPGVAYALTLALWGHHLTPWWPAPLQLPRVLCAALAVAVVRAEGLTPARLVPLLLTLGQLGGVLGGTWGCWPTAGRAWSVTVWGACALALAYVATKRTRNQEV